MTTDRARRWLITLVLPLGVLPPAAESARAQQSSRAGTVVTADTLVAFSSGNATTCVTTASGAGYCWGQVGERRLDADGRPARLRSTSPGWLSLCAQTIDGQAACEPTLMGGATDSTGKWKRIESCDYRLCVLPLPAYGAMPAGPLRAVDAGWGHACALTLDGSAFCWGRNDQGQLGNGSWAADSGGSAANLGADGLPPDYRDTTNRQAQAESYYDPCFLGGRCSPAPVEVSPGRRWSRLAVGSNHACALADDDGGVYCWGGTDTAAVGLGINLVACVNRSKQWQDARCQVAPVRVPGLPRFIARPISEATRDGASTPPPGVRLTVSRRAVRVVFPRDDSGVWGWSALVDPEYSPWYDWVVSVEGMDGPRSLRLLVGRTNDSARRFSSLDRLVAAARPALCSPGMIQDCSSTNMSASVEDGHVVLMLRDSAAIARLFGLRPATVRVWTSRPSDVPRLRLDSATVQYVEPQIAVPNAAALADAKASRRRYEASINTITRRIAIDHEGFEGPLWLSVGDSLPLSIAETHCHHDVCGVTTRPIGDSLWRLDDSSIAGVRAATPSRPFFHMLGPSAQLVGRRPGHTILRIALPPIASDTAPSSSPPARALTRDVVVMRPMRRIAFGPRPDSVRVGETIELRVRVTDDQGRSYENPPARVTVTDGDQRSISLATAPLRVSFPTPGTRTLVARYGVLADTLALRVVPVR